MAALKSKEEGLALIFVLSLTGVILAVLADILFQSQITVRTSVGERDRVYAELSAVTGAQFAKMLVGVEAKEVREAAKAGAGMMKAQLGGKNLSQMLDGFPIGSEGFADLKDLSKVDINALLDEALINALKAVPGYFVLKTSNESAKFNVNLLEGSEKKVAFLALKRIFSLPREAKFLQEKGYTPERLAANVMDYIDRDSRDEIDKGDEEVQYSQAKFNHKPKNGKLETLDELRRIPGFHDDEIFNVFSPYFTLWPMDAKEKSLDVNAASVELLAALFTQDGQEVNEGEFDKVEDKRFESETFSQERDLANAFGVQDADSKMILSRLIGIRSSVYRVEVRGVSNGIERLYTMVLEVNLGKAKPSPAAPAPAAVGAVPGAEPSSEEATAGAAGVSNAEGNSALRIVYQKFQ